MELALTPQKHLCPLEALLSIYAPILECLVSHLPTSSKLALSQTSRSLRQLLHSYPPFFAHLDFRLSVFESANFDSYPLGTVYNLDRLLQSLPVDGRIVSLTLDWTAVSGSFLFNKILDRCSQTLEHLSVRGCRKVSIKHHIVPHFVYQSSILPIGNRDEEQQKPVLKSLYVYKARGVRRKPFLIDRKPADGDEPSRYLTTLAANLGIWIDLGLCPTPKLRCPRRREILRRGKENFCVPFDKRWRVQDDNESFSEVEHLSRRIREQTYGEGLLCWNCDEAIPDRCEACVHQMTCSSCERPLCHNCSYISRATLGQVVQHAAQSASSTVSTVAATAAVTASTPAQWVVGLVGLNAQPAATDHDDAFEAELCAIRSKLLTPCCRTAPGSHADNLCAPCYEETRRAACSLCDKPLCIKHELERCRRCEGGCGRLFCFSTAENRESGCGESENGRAQMKDCLGCGMEVCGMCRTSFANKQPPCHVSPPSPVPSSSEDDDGSESTISAGERHTPPRKTSCACKVCLENYYCPSCWPTKPIPCEPRPATILQRCVIMNNAVTLLHIAFEDPSEEARWYTLAALSEQHPNIFPTMIEEYTTREQLQELSFLPTSTPPSPTTAAIKVAHEEWILERVLAMKPGIESADTWHPPPPTASNSTIDGAEAMVLCKWLGRPMTEVTWERNECFAKETHPREREMVDQFIDMCMAAEEGALQQEKQEQEEEEAEAEAEGSVLI